MALTAVRLCVLHVYSTTSLLSRSARRSCYDYGSARLVEQASGMAEEVQTCGLSRSHWNLCVYFSILSAALRSQTRLPCVSIALHMLFDNIAELLPSS